MRVLFVQDIWYEVPATMLLSACLKKAGHEVELFIGRNRRAFLDELKRVRPGMIAFSTVTEQIDYALDMARFAKEHYRRDIHVTLGGIHPTLLPSIVTSPFIDSICRGEGEMAIVELAEKVEGGKREALSNKTFPNSAIGNIWYKDGKRILRGEIRPLVEDLDSLPFMDRGLYYDRYKFLRDNPLKIAIGSRGCPFSCRFCFSSTLKELFKGKGCYVRFRSPESFVEELELLKKNYPVEILRFYDDTFGLRKEWLKAFSELYRKRVRLPYICYLRADMVDEERVALLAESGCVQVHMGIESGDEKFRNHVLGKGISNARIIESARLLSRKGIRLRTTQMLGMPGETFEMAYRTVRLNSMIAPESSWVGVFQAFPGLPLTEEAERAGLLMKEHVGWNSHRINSVLSPEKREIMNLHKLFFLAYKFPSLEPLWRFLVRLPLDRLYYALYILSYGYIYWLQTGVKPSRLISDGFHLLSFFLKK